MPVTRKIVLLFVFGVAMAYLESAVVVYLRTLYYPDGFQFPMVLISPKIAAIEIGRELATLIMLWTIAQLGGKSFRERFSYFCFSFGVWDLFYYIWLKVLLNWPMGLLEWDILFLIPLPWIAPWLAPALVSIALIAASILVLIYPQKFLKNIFTRLEWFLVLTSGLIILASFFFQTQMILAGGVPVNYHWGVFFSGYILGLSKFVKRIVWN